MSILSYIRKYSCLALLAIPSLSHAQSSIEQKVDSMKQAFKRMEAIRRQSGSKDTIKNELIRSPSVVIYNNINTVKSIVSGVHQLSLQAIRFRHSHYLNLALRVGLAKPVSLNEQGKLYLTSADHSIIILKSNGRAVLKGSEKRNSSELKLAYDLSDDDFRLLLNKKIISARIDYVGGEWGVNIDNDGSDNIKKVCMLIQ